MSAWRRWRDDPGYRVGQDGTVIGPMGRPLAPWRQRNGYLYVRIRGRSFQLHRVVCEAWHGAPPSDLHEVAHKDGDKDNNASRNLKWKTRSQNAEDRTRHGTTLPDAFRRRLTEDQVREIRSLAQSESSTYAIGDLLGIDQRTVKNVVRRQTWRQVSDEPSTGIRVSGSD